MRTWERLTKLKAWLEGELCAGREMKSPVPQTGTGGRYGPDITDFTTAEPRVFIGWQPARPSEAGKFLTDDPNGVCPAITIMPTAAYARYQEEHRFDRYNNIYRTQDMGQGFNVQMLFSVYEPGERQSGFAASIASGKPDLSLLSDGTEPGLKTLFNWMDDGIELFLRERTVPGTDLVLEDDKFMYALFTDQTYIVDRRPLYHGFLNVEFKGYASAGNDHGKPSRAARLLEGQP